MSKFMDAVVNAREDEDEAQMRSLFYGSGGFDSEDEDATEVVVESVDEREGAAHKIVATVSSVKVASNSDITITVQECREKGIAHQIWPAATFLAEYIVENPHLLYGDSPVSAGDDSTQQEELSILELGAGLGVTGIFAAKYFSENSELPHLHLQHTVLSDLAEALTGLQDNIALNHMHDSVSASVLSWGVQEELGATLDVFQTAASSSAATSDVKRRKTLVILAADVIYWEHLFNPLIATIEQVLARVHRTQEFDQVRILIAHYKRWKKDQAFLQRIQKSLQKSGHGTFSCLHEEVLHRHENSDGTDEVQKDAASSIAVEGKKEIRRIYQIKSTLR